MSNKKLVGNESNSESIDTESDIDLDNYEYYDNHNRDIDFLIEDYIDLNNSLFNYEGSNKNEIDIRPDGYEKQFRLHCPRCNLLIAYEMTERRKNGQYTYIVEGSLTENQGVIPHESILDD
ncbi:6562_t:CDS:2 [Entrophospora sp. SA101]|nr:6562_t:CDS:2 [Entrophospora sp. SA101]CAJ0844085.1 1013_t:CDS:2 [Entrophospora sp. SA101]CAJ0918236.1 5610_t:CDS:2 [Entrophospora sp. SA101]